jgi:uncharacterized membrane protein
MTATCKHQAAEHRATARLTFATWALCLVTAVLVVATIMLAAATAKEKEHHVTPAATTEEVATKR